MKVNRTEQIYIGYNENISNLCHISKNLFNQSNYILRQQYMKREMMSSYCDLVKQFSHRETDENNNFQKLPAQTAQWTVKMVKQSWKSFFRIIKEYAKHPEKFRGKPKMPKYKSKDGEFILIFTNQQCKIVEGVLKFPKIMNMEVKTRLNNVDLREVRIVPQGTGYLVEIVYRKDVKDIAEIDPTRITGIDFGIRNTVTIADNIHQKGIAVKGGALNSVNQFFNMEYSRLKSISDRQIGTHCMTKRERRLFMSRKRKMKDIMHKISRFIIKYAKETGIDTIVMGHNIGWKQKTNMGRHSNQKFVQIPFNTLISMIRYKAEEARINTITIDESHTSKCSFLDGETIEHHESYVGKRISRGLFRSSDGTVMNADSNAAYNMIRKAIPKSFEDGIEGVGLHPRSLSIRQMITSKEVC
jgi:putative transposase